MQTFLLSIFIIGSLIAWTIIAINNKNKTTTTIIIFIIISITAIISIRVDDMEIYTIITMLINILLKLYNGTL